jgi:YHS domain-containing protein
MAVCPVCKSEVEEKKARATSTHKEQQYFFDSKACKKTFDANPEQFTEK